MAVQVTKAEVSIEETQMTDDHEEHTAQTPKVMSVLPASRSNMHFKIMKAAIDDFVEATLRKGIVGLQEEFLRISRRPIPHTDEFKSFYSPTNLQANRYKNVPCFEQSRVVLQTHPQGKDYIHANTVASVLSPERFICTQGPLPWTVYDFWLMVLEKKVQAVVQLCSFVEGDTIKCCEYFPDNPFAKEMIYNDITVKCIGESLTPTNGHCVQRVLSVTRGNRGQEVLHFTMEEWSDHSVPQNDTTLLIILQRIRVSVRAPIIVHCSAGIGRTGTLVAMENLLESLMLGCATDAFSVVLALRKQRALSVQRESQYLFLNRQILQYLIAVCQTPQTPAIDKFFAEYDRVVPH